MSQSKCCILLLPTETVWDICVWLVPCREPSTFRIFQDYRDEVARLAGLVSLGRSCKSLRAVVSRFQAEKCPFGIKDIPPFRLEVLPYTLRILRDQELARREVTFRYNPQDDGYGEIEALADFKLLYETLERLGLAEGCWWGIQQQYRRRVTTNEWDQLVPVVRQIITNMSRLPSAAIPLGLALAHLPNLTSITISCAHFIGAVGYMGSLKTRFPSVRHLELTSPESVGHIDSAFGLARFTALLEALPSLESLVTYNCCGNCEVTLPNLRHLALDSANFSGYALRKLLGNCPRLEGFRYTASWTRPRLQIYDILNALQPVKDTLQCLEIRNYRSNETAASDLKQFISLYDLCLSQETLYSAFVEQATEFRLRNILPNSLKKLVLVDFDANFVPILQELADDLKFSEFPFLTEIIVHPSHFLRTRIDRPPAESPDGTEASYQMAYRTDEEVLRAIYRYQQALQRLFDPFTVAVTIPT